MMVQEFVCTGEECLTCPLPDCMRGRGGNSIKPEKFRYDGNRVGRGNQRMQKFYRREAKYGGKER